MKNTKNWTVMIYLVGDTNLSVDFIWSILEICRVCDDSKAKNFNIVVQFDPSAPGFSTKRYIISELIEGLKKGIPLDELGEEVGYSETAAATVPAIKEFLIRCFREFPDTHRLLVLGGHASGVIGGALLDENSPGVRSNTISTGGIFRALDVAKNAQGVRKIDIFGLDCCVMNSLEVGSAVSKSVDYLVAAEGLEPKAGWPFEKILTILKDDPTIEPENFARLIVKEHTRYYEHYLMAGVSTDMSACNLKAARELRRLTNELATELLEHINERSLLDALVLSHWKAQSYNFENFVDIWDFCNLLEESCPDNFKGAANIKEACRKVKDFVKKKYVLKSCHTGAAFQHSHGVSIYFPWSEDEEELRKYGKLFFSKRHKWVKFLREYLAATQRAMREGTGDEKPPERSGRKGREIRGFVVPVIGRVFPDIPGSLIFPDIPGSLIFPDIPGSLGREMFSRVKNMPVKYKRDECE